MGKYDVLRDDDERLKAKALAVGDFWTGVGGRLRKRRLYAALDEGRAGLAKLKIASTDGEALAALAGAYARSQGIIKYFREQKSSDDLGTKAAQREFVELFGRYAAERYLRDKRISRSDGPSLTAVAVTKAELRALVTGIVGFSREEAEADAQKAPDELTIKETTDWLVAALGRYESAIPQLNEDGSVPAATQDKGIAKAAFLGLRAEDLRKLVSQSSDPLGKDELEAATRDALADRLAAEYGGREQEIAHLVLGGQDGASRSGAVTRLMPLADAPTDLASVVDRIKALNDRYYETGTAEWFCFRDAVYASGTLLITGEILGYRVGTTQVKDEARLQPTRQREQVVVRLSDGDRWAQTNARRASHLLAISRVLRRTELAITRPLVAPEAVSGEPYSRCDSRTLWMLELLARELSADPFQVVDHIMVNFERERPKTASLVDGDGSVEAPFITAIRLRGVRLIDHPEVCELILGQRRVVDVEVAVRVLTGQSDPKFAPRIRTRLTWADDHLALTTSPLQGDYDVKAHSVLVRQLRAAAVRQIDKAYVQLPMQRVLANSKGDEADPGLGSVIA